MSSEQFVPEDFEPPRALEIERFRLEPLGPEHNESDLAAWSSSIEHIRATKGYPDGSWPPAGGMSPEQNLADLTRHAADFEARAVTRSSGACTSARGRAELDGPLAEAVAAWLVDEWPWERPDRHGR